MLPCSPESWLSHPKFVLIFSHFMALIVFPLHLLTAFCILKRTPPSMSTVKWTILNLHFWNMMVDCLMNIFIIPCPLFPTVSGYLLGVFSALGVRATVQAWILATALGMVCVSTTMIFENRFYLIIAKFGKWRRIRPFWKLANIIFCLIICIPTMMQLPDQAMAKEAVLNNLPCVSPFLLTVDIITPTLDDNVFIFTSLAFCVIVFGQIIAFATVLSIQLATDFGASTLSEYTRRLQRKLLKALILQTGIPFVYLLLPVVFAVVLVSTDYFDFTVNNLIVVLTSFHGLVSTSSMLLIHAPYRHAVRWIIWRKRIPRVGVEPAPMLFTRTTNTGVERRNSTGH